MSRFAFVSGSVLLATAAFAPLAFVVRLSLYESAGSTGFFKPNTWTIQHYAALLDAPIRFTMVFAVLIALGSTLLAFGFSLWFLALSSRWHALAASLLLTPKFVGALCYAFGLQRLLPRGTATALLAEVSFVLPYAALAILARLSGPTSDLLLAARGLGANRWQAFWRITRPLAMPGVFVAFVLSLAWGLGAMIGPMLLATPAQATLATQLQLHVTQMRWPVAAAEGVLLFSLTMITLTVPVPAVRE